MITHQADRTFATLRLLANLLILLADKYNARTKVTSGGTAANMTRNFNWNAATGRQRVTAFDLATRKRLWKKETSVAPFGLGARNGNVYLFDGEQVLSLNADSSQVKWTSQKFRKARVPFSTGAVLDRRRVQPGLRRACLYGLMPANGMLYAPPGPDRRQRPQDRPEGAEGTVPVAGL